MLSKSKRILFGMLHVIMLLVMVHWFLISVTYLREISWLAILGAGLLFLLAWLKRDGLKSAFAWLTRHKKGFLLGAVVFQLIVMVCADSLFVGMLRLFSKGLLIFLSNPLSPTTSVAIPITFRSFFTRSFSMSYLALAVCGSCRLSISSMSIWVQSSCTSCPRSISIKKRLI